MTHAIEVRNLSKSFRTDARALDDVSLQVAPGEMVALLGASGSGKSTLLRHVAGFIGGDAGSGDVRVFGNVVQQGGRVARNVRELRAGIGFVFQQFNLVGRLPVITNVLTGLLPHIPLWRSLIGHFRHEETDLGLEALAQVGIDDYAFQRASTLSGGQQQRAAIARTLVQNARVLLADEPIASLDPESARRVMELLAQINRKRQVTVVVSLHQVDIAMRFCPRVVALRRGKVVYDGPSAALTPAMLRELYGTDAAELLDGTTLPDTPNSLTPAATPGPMLNPVGLAA